MSAVAMRKPAAALKTAGLGSQRERPICCEKKKISAIEKN